MTVRERNGAWQAIVVKKRGGVIVHQESQTFTGPHAERLARSWKAKMTAKLAGAGGVEARKASITKFRSLVEKYAEALEAVKPMSRSRAGELDQLMRSSLAPMQVDRITAHDLVRFANERQTEGAGPATIKHNLTTVQAMFGAAKPMFGIDLDKQIVSEAIASLARVGMVGAAGSRERRLAPGEFEALIAEFERVSTHPDTVIPMAKIVQVAVHFPRRREELLHKLRWDGLDKRKRTALLLDTKNPNRVRNEIVPVPRAAWEIIMGMPVIAEEVFPYKPASVSKAFERACARLNIQDLRFHDLRHEGISRLFEAGLDIPEVCVISGHLEWKTLKRYTQLRPENILQKLDGATANADPQTQPEGSA